MNLWSRDLGTDLTLLNSLFGTVKLIKNPDHNKYLYFEYGIKFDYVNPFHC